MAKEKKSAPKEVKVTGFLEEVDLPDGDIGLTIVDDDRSYLISMDKKGRSLLDYVDEEIELTGIVTKTKTAQEIKVSRFRAIDDMDDDEEDQEEVDFDDEDDFMSDEYDD